MSGFCEGCPVPEILSKVADEDGLNPYWSNPEVRLAAGSLMIELAEMADCVVGPEIEGLSRDTDEVLVVCSHPKADVLSCLGDTLDIIGDYVDVTPTLLERTGTQAELQALSRQE